MMDNIEFLEILQRASLASPAEHKINLGYMPVFKAWPQSEPKQPAIYEMPKGWAVSLPLIDHS